MFPCVLLSLHRKPKNHHNRHYFWSTLTMLSGGTPTASNTSHSSNHEFRMTWTMLIREHLPQHKRKNSQNHNLDYLKYYFMFNRSWYSEVWEWYSKDYNCAPVGRVRHVHWDFDKAENKDISEVTIFHAFTTKG